MSSDTTRNTKLQEVIDRALIDANFAEELKTKAILAMRAGRGTDEWGDLMEYFAKDSTQLMHFKALVDETNECTATTSLTVTVTSTVDCMFTTTGTTTSIFC